MILKKFTPSWLWERLNVVYCQHREWRRAAVMTKYIDQDYQACAPVIRRIVEEMPDSESAKKVWMLASLPMIMDYKLAGVLSWGLRLAGYSPVAVGFSHPDMDRYHSLFGLKERLNVRDLLGGAAEGGHDPSLDVVLDPGFTIMDMMDLDFHGVAVGRIALSIAMYRRRSSVFDFDAQDVRQDLKQLIGRSHRTVLTLEDRVGQLKPAMMCICERGLSPWAELVGVAWQRGIPVIHYTGASRAGDFILKRVTADNQFRHPLALEPDLWERIKDEPWHESSARFVLDGFRRAYETGSWFNRRLLQTDKRMHSRQELATKLELDSAKKTVVVFSHVLWDATFFYGKGLFPTYEEWLIATVRAACQNSSVNWVIKLHPDLVWKMRQECASGELYDYLAIKSAVDQLPGHVFVIPPETDINTYSFFHVTDVCVTVRGTIGMEMAAHGIPVITAGTGRYSGLGFTIDSDTREEYLEQLANINDVPAMSLKMVGLAQKYVDAVFRRRPWTLQAFEFVRKPPRREGDPLDHNLVPRIRSWQEFYASPDISQFVEWIHSGNEDYMSDRGDIWS